VSGGCNVVLTNTGELWDLRGHLAAGGGRGKRGEEGRKQRDGIDGRTSLPSLK